MDGATIAAAVSGLFVVLVSGGSFAYVIHRNGVEKAHLSGKYEQKVVDLAKGFEEFKSEVRRDIASLREEVRHCRDALDDRR